MKIDFEDEFFDYILSRGYDYYASGKVSKVRNSKDYVTAIVHGNDEYNVKIEINDGVFINGECSCPYNANGEYCKHIAAVLYYLNDEKGAECNNRYNLEDIINKINDKKIKKFLYNSLINNDDLLNKFRIEFSDFFPKLSKKSYENKIYNAIRSCGDRKYGFIDYSNAYRYEHVMLEFINEAEKLVDNGDYNTAFTIVTILLDSIPRTEIDDSNGSTGMVADSCIEIIFDILDIINTDDRLLKDILNYVISDVKSLYLYNYGIDLKGILEYFINEHLYLDEIKNSLETALDNSKDKEYFYCRKDYINYLIQIYILNDDEENIIKLLEKYSYDENICMMYVDELVKENKLEDAIKILKSNLREDNYKNKKYALKLGQVYYDNKMNEEYKNILYDIFYKYSSYDFDIYLKIKELYSNMDWDKEKIKIIEKIKKDKYVDRILNQIYIEEKMFDDLFLNICNYGMGYIKEYEKYLLPKYNSELLDIYKNSCLNSASKSSNRKSYRDVAIQINHIIDMDNSIDVVRAILSEINEKYFRNRPAMVNEFENVIKNLEQYF
ncbi:MAG: SWIM zinc finger family protein [Bacilli bacterium]|nr:SWIM zinc finger family protein [Bacilli bacterium]